MPVPPTPGRRAGRDLPARGRLERRSHGSSCDSSISAHVTRSRRACGQLSGSRCSRSAVERRWPAGLQFTASTLLPSGRTNAASLVGMVMLGDSRLVRASAAMAASKASAVSSSPLRSTWAVLFRPRRHGCETAAGRGRRRPSLPSSGRDAVADGAERLVVELPAPGRIGDVERDMVDAFAASLVVGVAAIWSLRNGVRSQVDGRSVLSGAALGDRRQRRRRRHQAVRGRHQPRMWWMSAGAACSSRAHASSLSDLALALGRVRLEGVTSFDKALIKVGGVDARRRLPSGSVAPTWFCCAANEACWTPYHGNVPTRVTGARLPLALALLAAVALAAATSRSTGAWSAARARADGIPPREPR